MKGTKRMYREEFTANKEKLTIQTNNKTYTENEKQRNDEKANVKGVPLGGRGVASKVHP